MVINENWVLTMHEMLWQIEQTSCEPVLKDCIDWLEGVIDQGKCDFDDNDFEIITKASQDKLNEFNERVLH